MGAKQEIQQQSQSPAELFISDWQRGKFSVPELRSTLLGNPQLLDSLVGNEFSDVGNIFNGTIINNNNVHVLEKDTVKDYPFPSLYILARYQSEIEQSEGKSNEHYQYILRLPEFIRKVDVPADYILRPINEFTPPNQDTFKLLHHFNAENSTDLLERTKGIVKGFFKTLGNERAAEPVNSTINLVNELFEGVVRNTGELKVAHEVRIILRFMTDYLFLSEELKEQFEYNRRGLTKQMELAALMCGILLHDVFEDLVFEDKFIADRASKNQIIFRNIDGSKELLTKWPNDKNFYNLATATFGAYTTIPISPLRFPFSGPLKEDFQSEQDQLQVLLTSIQNFSGAKPWGINDGKVNDRIDNLMTLDTYHLPKFQRKLLETWDKYRNVAIGVLKRNYPGDNRIAPLLPDTLMMLLGTTNDEIYGWAIGNPIISAEFQRLQDEGKQPLIIPAIDMAVIMTNTGELFSFKRTAYNPQD